MSDVDVKPLNWSPAPNVGYTVVRRKDGGMSYTFTDLERPTLEHWRAFALAHLEDSDRLTRNLYDLRQVGRISEEAVKYALEVGSDPAVRNIRLAVLVTDEQVRGALQEIAALTTRNGIEIGIFKDPQAAEAWLSRPLELLS